MDLLGISLWQEAVSLYREKGYEVYMVWLNALEDEDYLAFYEAYAHVRESPGPGAISEAIRRYIEEEDRDGGSTRP